LLKKNTANAWSEPSSANPTDSELSDAGSSKKKKGRKGKQVLFRVGL
jgi:hypothetical protein